MVMHSVFSCLAPILTAQRIAGTRGTRGADVGPFSPPGIGTQSTCQPDRGGWQDPRYRLLVAVCHDSDMFLNN